VLVQIVSRYERKIINLKLFIFKLGKIKKENREKSTLLTEEGKKWKIIE